MRLLITGAAGFIGSNLADSLIGSNYIVGIDNFDPFYDRSVKETNIRGLLQHPDFTFYEMDLLDSDKLDKIVNENNIELIIHLAAKAGVRPSILDPVGYTKHNIEGTVNIDTIRNNSKSCYKIDLSANNGVEKYAFYMNLFEGTYDQSSYDVKIKVYNENGDSVKTFSTGLMDGDKAHMKEQFEITQSGTYYIKISRDSRFATNYKFSIHPSLENGLVQDYEGELGEINDFSEMATPLTMNADNSLDPTRGSVNITRQLNTSTKYTDDRDWYSIDIQNSGTYNFDMTLLSGTDDKSSYNVGVKIYNSFNVKIKTFSTGSLDEAGASISDTFDVSTPGTYFIWIYREERFTAKYNFSISLP